MVPDREARDDQPMTLTEFLAWEGAPDERYELIDGEVVVLGGDRLGEARVAMELRWLIGTHLQGSRCEVWGAGLLVKLDDRSAVLPDVFVTCQRVVPGTSQLSDPPVLVIEVLSPETSEKDRGVKLPRYQALPSVQQCVLVDPNIRSAESHSRLLDGRWEVVDHTASGVLPLPSIDLDLPLEKVFGRLGAI